MNPQIFTSRWPHLSEGRSWDLLLIQAERCEGDGCPPFMRRLAGRPHFGGVELDSLRVGLLECGPRRDGRSARSPSCLLEASRQGAAGALGRRVPRNGAASPRVGRGGFLRDNAAQNETQGHVDPGPQRPRGRTCVLFVR